MEVPTCVHVVLLEKMAEIDYRLCSGASEKLQLSALIAAFQMGRQLVDSEAE